MKLILLMKFFRGAAARDIVCMLVCPLLLAGCGQMQAQSSQQDLAEAPPAAERRQELASAGKGITDPGQLMLRRRELCRMTPQERRQWVDDYRAAGAEVGTEKERDLRALMIASCEPARTPGLLRQILAEVEGRDWSAEYRAFFDLLSAHQRAYQIVDDSRHLLRRELDDLLQAHEKLQNDYEALKLEHQKTIEGISDIERGIDAPRVEDLGL